MKHRNKKILTEKQEKKRRKYVILGILEGAAVLAVVTALFLYNLGVFAGSSAAIKIDGEAYELPEFNYYFYACYNAYLDENSQYLSYMFDQSKSLKEQEYTEGQSWFDFFLDQAQDSMKSIITVAKEADRQGYVLSDKQQAAMDAAVEEIKDSAAAGGMTTDEFLKNIYGEGMTLDRYRKHLTYSYLAAGYSEKIKEEFTVSDQETEAFYHENLEKYTYVNYERFYVKACDAGETPDKKQKEQALSVAEEIRKKAEKGTPLKELGEEYKEYGAYYAFEDAYYDKSFSYGSWLFSKDRKEGDLNIIDDGSGYYVMLFHGRDQSEYASVNLLDIFLSADVDLLDTAAEDYEEQKNQRYEDSCRKAEEIYDKWKAGGRDRKELEALAQSCSVSENAVFKDHKQLVKQKLDGKIDDWCFDPARKEGDCAVLYTDAGFHVVYYAGTDVLAWQIRVKEDLRTQKYEAWYDEITKGTTVERQEGIMNKAGENVVQ